MKKKTFLAFFAVFILLFCLCAFIACGKTSNEGKTVVTTIFPEYDWVKNVLGDNTDVNVVLLQDSGADLHNYTPSPEDVVTLSTCDLFIYVGGESDKWVEDALKNAINKNMQVLNLMEILGDRAKEEELAEGMEGEEEEEDEEGEVEYDEHVWLSVRNAAIFTEAIARALGKIDPDKADTYLQNARAYNESLTAMDNEYQAAVAAAGKKTLLFGDRFPFRYLIEDYGLQYYAAFLGCSAETEASFETIVFLASKVDELDLHTVLTIESSDGRIARTIVQNTQKKNQAILAMDSLQSATKKEYAAGKTYLSVMRSNLEILKAALA